MYELERLKQELIERELIKGIDISYEIASCQEKSILLYLLKIEDCEIEHIGDTNKFIEHHFKAFNEGSVMVIREGIEQGLDISMYAKPGLTYFKMEEIRKGLEEGLDVSWYADPKFSSFQMGEIRKGLEQCVDVSWYTDPTYDGEQMEEILSGLMQSLDVSWYANPDLDWRQMSRIREGLEHDIDVSLYADPKFHNYQMCLIKEGLKAGIDVTPFTSKVYENKEIEKKIRLIQAGKDPYAEKISLLGRVKNIFSKISN